MGHVLQHEAHNSTPEYLAFDYLNFIIMGNMISDGVSLISHRFSNRHDLFSCRNNSLLAGAVDKFGKWYFPRVHLDDLYPRDDLIHQPHTFICSDCSFQSILRCLLSKETYKQFTINAYSRIQSVSQHLL